MELKYYYGKKLPHVPKICHTYPTMMKLGTAIPFPKKIQDLYELRDTLLEFRWHQHFLTEIGKFCYIKEYRYWFQLDTSFIILPTFLQSLRIVLINMVTILMVSAKMAIPGLLKIKVFCKKCYEIIMSVQQNFFTWFKL